MMINYSNIFVNDGLTYQAYRDLIDVRLAEGKTTGPDSSEDLLHYAKMNVYRMARLDKTVSLNEEFLSVLSELKGVYRLLVITEGWCGDAAQLVPVFKKIEEAAPDKFSLRLVLRDQHLDLIDAHLTNGGRAIPILLILDQEGRVLNKWGPRPAMLKPLLEDWKKEYEDMMVVAEKLHFWYANDKTYSTQQELAALFKSLA